MTELRSPKFKAWALLACLAGLIASILLLQTSTGQVSSWGCPVGGCAKISSSPLGSFLWVPLPEWGVAFWATTFLCVLKRPYSKALGYLVGLGAVFSIGLGWAQVVVGEWCPLCSVSGLAALLLAGLYWRGHERKRTEYFERVELAG